MNEARVAQVMAQADSMIEEYIELMARIPHTTPDLTRKILTAIRNQPPGLDRSRVLAILLATALQTLSDERRRNTTLT